LVKVNGEEVEWDRAPNFVNNIQRKVLWRNEKTGAMFVILRAPKGVHIEQKPHSHPKANQFTLMLSGEAEFPDGTHVSFSEDDYFFRYNSKNEEHGALPDGVKVLKDQIWIHYWDGPDDWGDKEGEE
jgi:hypothetical protein